ncbi:unnamed protein product [Phyllotreta striolata]|uniref:Uncharacterized protein n=1 Tax=Phyllotreta striolata TaxID=444603 RepID=A0A9N9TRN9_PHYSR|nr:unnamed protein product [Phyllotreta striolata]
MKNVSRLTKQERDQSKTVKEENENFLNTFDRFVLSILFILMIINVLLSIDPIAWRLCSLGRILMIKSLPYYDWRPWKTEQCLINNKSPEKTPTTAELNCNTCEDTFKIDVHEYLNEDILEERYVNVDAPVVLTKAGVEQWPNDTAFIEQLLEEPDFAESYPCTLSGSFTKQPADLRAVLAKRKYFDRFLVHFRNCEPEAVRTFRSVVNRPRSLPDTYSPTLYNWALWSRGYKSSGYKRVELVEKVAVVGQLVGATRLQLVPRGNCREVCSTLGVTLRAKEVLVFTGLWDLEYMPGHGGENFAVVMEF